MDKRRTWLAIIMEEAMNLGVLEPEEILRFATPAVLATDLPPTLVASLLQDGLDQGIFSPELMVSHLGPRALAEHLPLPVLWNCINDAAETIITEHPMSKGSVSADEVGAVVDMPAGTMLDQQDPDIEVIED